MKKQKCYSTDVLNSSTGKHLDTVKVANEIVTDWTMQTIFDIHFYKLIVLTNWRNLIHGLASHQNYTTCVQQQQK